MISKINSAGITGIQGYGIQVETDVSIGVPTWDIVGMPDIAVRESKERLRTAIKQSGYQIPGKRIVVNLAPAAIKKEGAYLDLPIAMGILASSEQIFIPDIEKKAFFGELSLDGRLRPFNGALPMAITAYQNGIRQIYLPVENAAEAAAVDGLQVYGVNCLEELCEHLKGVAPIEPCSINIDELFRMAAESNLDFSEVKGQKGAKRALEVAAAGGHNVLMFGNQPQAKKSA